MSPESKQSRREQSHERILDAAARAVCRDGYAGVGVAAVMKEAGLTHGGFYAHFESREALLAAAIAHAGAKSIERMQARTRGMVAKGVTPLRALVEGYLSEAHLNTLDQGCPVAALASEMPASAKRMMEVIKLVEDALPANSRVGAAVTIASTMIGAMQMARMFDGEQRMDVLRDCRAALLSQYDRSGESS
jgi:TetR/AcrR family transcriptional repressor of nem operon